MARFHAPRFNEFAALRSIELVEPDDSYVTLVASTDHDGLMAAWEALQGKYLDKELRIRHGAMVMHRRAKA